jgi:hypothetical protein
MQTEKDDDDLVDYNELEDTSPPLDRAITNDADQGDSHTPISSPVSLASGEEEDMDDGRTTDESDLEDDQEGESEVHSR